MCWFGVRSKEQRPTAAGEGGVGSHRAVMGASQQSRNASWLGAELQEPGSRCPRNFSRWDSASSICPSLPPPPPAGCFVPSCLPSPGASAHAPLRLYGWSEPLWPRLNLVAFLVAFFEFLSDLFLSHFPVQILGRLELVLPPGSRWGVAGQPVDDLWGWWPSPFWLAGLTVLGEVVAGQ